MMVPAVCGVPSPQSIVAVKSATVRGGVGVGERARPAAVEDRRAELRDGKMAASVVLTVGCVAEAVSGASAMTADPEMIVTAPAVVGDRDGVGVGPRLGVGVRALMREDHAVGRAGGGDGGDGQGRRGRAVAPVDHDRAGGGGEVGDGRGLVGVGEGAEQDRLPVGLPSCPRCR